MKKIALALAAVGFMMAAPAVAAPVVSDANPSITYSPGTQLAQVNVRIGPGGNVRVRERGYRPGYRRGWRQPARVCTSRTVFRNGRRIVTRTCR